jgi:pimeloyl-ACP methyl ester carboxylesterase
MRTRKRTTPRISPGVATGATAAAALGAAAVAVAAGRHASARALRPGPHGLDADRLTVHDAAPGEVRLTRTLDSLRPGVWGLTGPGLHATVGDVLSTTPDSVTRAVTRIAYGTLRPGDRDVRLTPQAYAGTPASAHGLDYRDVLVPGGPGAPGDLPAWHLDGPRDLWVITVHGLGTTREHPLVVLPLLHRLGVRVLDLAYRNDPGAPATRDGVSHLGADEWHDLHAAMEWAVRVGGARRLVLYGWSTGATMALRAAAHSPLAGRVTGLVLDSPVLDWRSTLRAAAAARGAPAPVLPLAVRAAEARFGAAAADSPHRPARPRPAVPTFVAHGPDDTIASWHATRRLVDAVPALATLHTVPEAPHAAMWNPDPAAYEEHLRRFLTPLL